MEKLHVKLHVKGILGGEIDKGPGNCDIFSPSPPLPSSHHTPRKKCKTPLIWTKSTKKGHAIFLFFP